MRPFETRQRGKTIVWDFGDATITWDQASRRKLAPSRLHGLKEARWEPLEPAFAWSRIRMTGPKVRRTIPRERSAERLAEVASMHPSPYHVDLWVGLGGLGLAVRAAAIVFREGRARACMPLVQRLRSVLVDADDIDAVRSSFGGDAYSAAAITDEPMWTHDALRAFLRRGAKPAKLLPELGPYVCDPALALEVARATFRSPYSLAPHALDLVAHLGPDAVPTLRLLLFERYTDGSMKPVVRALARIATGDAGNALIPMVTSPQLRTTVRGWVRRNPKIALPILDAWAAQAPAAALELGETDDLTSHLAVLREHIAPAARTTGAAWPAGAPEVLHNPPWTRPRAARLASSVTPRTAPVEYMGLTTGTEHLRPARLRARVRRADAGEPMFLYELLKGSNAEVLEVWNEGRPERYRGGHAVSRSGVGMITARLSEAALPGLLLHAEGKLAASIDGLADFISPQVAPVMARSFNKSKSPVPERWMLAHPKTAAIGLVPVAMGEPRARATEDCAHALRFLVSAGRREHVIEAAAEYGVDIEPVLSDDTPQRMPKPPAFLHLVRVQLRLRAGTALPSEATRTVATMLQLSRRVPYSGLAEVSAACDPKSTVALAKALFDAWHDQGAPPKHDWVIQGLGHLGDEALIEHLLPLIGEWQGRGAIRRIEKLLDAMAAMGTELALLHLDRIRRRHSHRSLRDAAGRSVTRVAARLALSAEQLEDRTAPTLGLERDGTTKLNLGPRTLEVVFDEGLRPHLRDARREWARFPGRRVADVGYEEAKARFALLRKRAKLVADQQVARLERMMTTERRVSIDEFERLFVRHPLVRHLVQRLVWRTDGGLEVRVAEDDTYANEHDDEVEIAGAIGVAHPLSMSALERWGDVFADYELVQPFRQIGRPTYVPRPDELQAQRILRVEGKVVDWEVLERNHLLPYDDEELGPVRLSVVHRGPSGRGESCEIVEAFVRTCLEPLSPVARSEVYLTLEPLY